MIKQRFIIFVLAMVFCVPCLAGMPPSWWQRVPKTVLFPYEQEPVFVRAPAWTGAVICGFVGAIPGCIIYIVEGSIMN